MLDWDGPWGWTDLELDKLREVVDKLSGWECLDHNAVFGASGNKPISVTNIVREAQRRLVELTYDDLDGLWELRLSGPERVWGKRDRHLFFPIWWDPRHEVCPSRR